LIKIPKDKTLKREGATSTGVKIFSSGIWWMISAIAFFGAVIALLILAAGMNGYFGSTGLRLTNKNDFSKLNSNQVQTDTISARDPGSGPNAANPIVYSASADKPRIEGNTIHIDSRINKLFNDYLANPNVLDSAKKPFAHEFIDVKTTDSKFSSLSQLPLHQPSISTLYRGVGIRVIGLDRVKCSWRRIDKDDNRCPVNWQPYKQYPILFSSDSIDIISVEAAADASVITGCLTACSADYFPNVESAPEDKTPNQKRQPGVSDINNIKSLLSEAAIYKMSMLTWELLSADDKFDSQSENLGYQKIVPYQIIVPQSLLQNIGNDWKTFVQKAQNSYVLKMQSRLSLGGLAFDPLLDTPVKAIHFNY